MFMGHAESAAKRSYRSLVSELRELSWKTGRNTMTRILLYKTQFFGAILAGFLALTAVPGEGFAKNQKSGICDVGLVVVDGKCVEAKPKNSPKPKHQNGSNIPPFHMPFSQDGDGSQM